MNRWRDVKERLLEDEELRWEYAALAPYYELVRSIIRLRTAKGLSQEDLARLLHTRKPAISRLESGRANPTIKTLQRVAEALDARLVIALEPQG